MDIQTSRIESEHIGPVTAKILRVSGPEELNSLAYSGDKSKGNAWHGNETAYQVFKAGAEGTNTYVPAVERLIEQVEANLATETQGYAIDNAVTGFLPDVVAAIQGHPEAMLQMVDLQADHMPVNVWCNTTMSGGFSTKEIAARGAAVAAFVMKLQAIRPVSLNVVVGLSRCNYLVCPINTRPMSIGQISYLLCSGGWTRHVYKVLEANLGAGVGWDKVFDAHGRKAYSQAYQEDGLKILGGDLKHDVFIPPLFLHDELAHKPVEWVSKTLARYFKGE